MKALPVVNAMGRTDEWKASDSYPEKRNAGVETGARGRLGIYEAMSSNNSNLAAFLSNDNTVSHPNRLAEHAIKSRD